VIWQEGKLPLIVVELISPTTEKEDLGRTLRDVSKPPTKWEVYERWLRVPYYLVFDRRTDHLRIFQLSANAYQQVEDHQNRLWIEEAELGIGLWQGRYLNLDRLWLRWYDREGNWLPTPVEQERAAVKQERVRAEQERVRAEQERVRAEQERIEKEVALRKAEQLAARLRELGIDPDHLSS
jgi:hypothetical protein